MRPIDPWQRPGQVTLPPPLELLRNPELERQVRRGEAGALEIYTDWLHENGDPRGQAMQMVLRRTGHDHTIAQWVETHAQVLAGDTHGNVHATRWRGPFPTSAFARQGVEDPTLTAWLDGPAAIMLTSLQLTLPPEPDAIPRLQALIARSAPSPLDTLSLTGNADLTGSWSDLEGIRSLALTGPLGVGGLELPDLEHLTWSDQLGAPRFTATDLPIRSVRIRANAAATARFLESTGLDALRALTLGDYVVTPEHVWALFDTGIARQLEEVTFSANVGSDPRPTEVLCANAARLERLERLRIPFLSGDLKALLAPSFPGVELVSV